MKIMSFNTQHCLNYLKREVDYQIMANTIKDLGADIVGLNEMFDGGNSFSRQRSFPPYVDLKIGILPRP